MAVFHLQGITVHCPISGLVFSDRCGFVRLAKPTSFSGWRAICGGLGTKLRKKAKGFAGQFQLCVPQASIGDTAQVLPTIMPSIV